MHVVTLKAELPEAVARLRRERGRFGLVPTMGALHAGHLSLVEAARRECGAVAVTIFVNPTQFGPREDLAKYPRPLERDLELLAAAGADLVFVPSADEIYPAGFGTCVDVGPIALPLEGRFRPTHFRGVATVVLKLFHLLPADVAYFGQKDYQQTLVVRQMVEDLNVGIEIRVCPTLREPDGLALSSRNAYLSAADRSRALGLWQALQTARAMVNQGERRAANIVTAMQAALLTAGVDSIDYVALVDPRTLADVEEFTHPTLATIAAHVGKTRLIDNEILTPDL